MKYPIGTKLAEKKRLMVVLESAGKPDGRTIYLVGRKPYPCWYTEEELNDQFDVVEEDESPNG